MNRFVPFEKMSKRRQREENQKHRKTWEGFNPVTRKPDPPCAYRRALQKKASNEKEDSFDSKPYNFHRFLILPFPSN